jgi:hypothetical protein
VTKRGSLSAENPELAKEFDRSKNGGLSPEDFSAGSDKKVWWIGHCGHSWEASVGHRTRGRGCPICRGSLVQAGVNDLPTTHPKLAGEFDKDRNAGQTPSDFSAGSNKKVWWIGDCGHSWHATVAHRASGTRCPVCDGKIVVSGFNDLNTTHPEIAKYWSQRNLPVESNSIHAGTPNKAWFTCEKRHEYKTAVNSKTRFNLGCPICSNKVLAPGVNDLATTHPSIAAKWHPLKNGSFTPSDFTIGSHHKAWFICSLGHEYQQAIKSSLLFACNKCSGRVVVAGENDLQTLRPDLAAEWNFELNDRIPADVMLGSDYKAWWIDQYAHVWQQGVQVRSRGVGCPKCARVGFDQTSPGLLYFIRHDGFGARKIGITNLRSRFDRLKGFSALGWSTIVTFQENDGAIILAAETQLFRWIRAELSLPAFLGKSEMGRMGGNTETFSGEGVSDREIIERIERTLARLRVEAPAASNQDRISG